nr:MAG TPA: hypothetical protein [Bacteriophage sp.]
MASTYNLRPLERFKSYLREFNLGIEIDSSFCCSAMVLSIRSSYAVLGTKYGPLK